MTEPAVDTTEVCRLLEQALDTFPRDHDSLTVSAARHLLHCALTAARSIDPRSAPELHPPDIVGTAREALTTATMLTRELRTTTIVETSQR
ncbi:hypothetical protein ACWDSJ_35785 [Nocardia sp. NPDC003482]